MLKNCTCNFCTVYKRSANFNVAVIHYSQNFFECNGIVSSCFQFFDSNYIAFSNAILFTTSFNNCVHENTSLLSNSLNSVSRPELRSGV